LVCLFLAVILTFAPIPFTEGRAEAAAKRNSNLYAINLVSILDPIDPSTVPKLKVFEKYLLYTTRHREDGKDWYRLRVGFFPTRKAADSVMRPLLKEFPEAWVTKVSAREKKRAKGLTLLAVPISPEAAPKALSPTLAPWKIRPEGYKALGKAKEPPAPDDKTAALMEKAERAMTGGKYTVAIGIYTGVLKAPESGYKLEARELLGLAYERRGEIAQAKAEYKTYIFLYPEGEGTERVRQRLAGIETAIAKPRKKLKKRRAKKEGVEVYGTLSQFYSRDESFTDLGGKIITRSTLSTDLDLNVRKRTTAYDVRSVVVGGYDWDFLESGAQSETRLSRLYVDVLNRRLKLSARAGRQSQSSGGVLGRFDGGLVSYQFIQLAKVNFVAGFPVESSVLRNIDTSRYFYGVSLDLGTFAERWDLNIFAIEQTSAGVTDRQAVGGEVRYFHPNRSFFSLVDYDTSYDELNTALFVGNLILPDKTTINTSIDFRNSPSLSTTNALQGQSVDRLKDLVDNLGEDAVRSLAMDRTAESRSASIGITHPLSEKLQVGGDVTVSEFTGTPASGGVEEMPGTGYEYFVSARLIGSSLLKSGDISIVGLSYTDASSSNTVSLNLNSRYPVNRDWRINPRLRVDFTKNDSSGADQLKIRPALKTDYYWRRFLSLELEAGAEWAHEWISDQTDSTFDYFLLVGYRLDF
jgi:hypothetical protein